MSNLISGFGVVSTSSKYSHYANSVHSCMEAAVAEAINDHPCGVIPAKIQITPKLIVGPEEPEEIIHLENGLRVRITKESKIKYGL